jgi:hypothetical protein
MRSISLAVLLGTLCSFLALAQGPLNAIDEFEKRIFQQRDALIEAERARQMIGAKGGLVDYNDFNKKMGELVKQYDEHVVLKWIAQLKEQGDLGKALILISEWERGQELSGLETDPQIVSQIMAEKPSVSAVLKQEYAELVHDCNPATAKDYAALILGVVRAAALYGADDLFPNWLTDATNCAILAPLYLSFDSHVEGALFSSDVKGKRLKVPFDPATGIYQADGLPLQYLALKLKPPCWKGDGISGTLTAIVVYQLIHNQSELTVQILPVLHEVITIGEPSRGGCTMAPKEGGQMNYWLGFVLTDGTKPFILDQDGSKTLKGSYKVGSPVWYTQQSTVRVERCGLLGDCS